ncbi:MAG: radical SAM protein [Bacteroidia bacterium]|nr:radical SAM protein [Bacteroidia bacterium]
MYKLSDYIERGRRFFWNRNFPHRRKISTLMIYATDLCDSRCQHCLIWKKRPVQYLPKETIFALMQNSCITPNTKVGLEGGEFLLHPDSREIMAWFHQHHPNFDLLSNCLKPDSLIEAVKASPPKRLFISLDGDKETYQFMRGKDGYENVIRVLRELKGIVPISVMFCLSQWNGPEALKHVTSVCREHGADLRVGVYSNIDFFDTEAQAYAEPRDWKIPTEIKEFAENYEYLLLYNEWRKGKVKLTCNSIMDSAVVLPNGDVPICLNLDTVLGNLKEHSLDEILYARETLVTLKDRQHNCNQCWINFHRKYDLILYRTFDKYFPRKAVSKMFGYHQWSDDNSMNYSQVIAHLEKQNQALSD